MTAPVAERLLTAEEYLELPDRPVRIELVRGKLVEIPAPTPEHGQICRKVARILADWIGRSQREHIITNNARILTKREPDTLRIADLAFFRNGISAEMNQTKGLNSFPVLVFQVRLANVKWSQVLRKVAEYLDARVPVVCVPDLGTESVWVFTDEEHPKLLRDSDELHLPDILGDFRVAVQRFFE